MLFQIYGENAGYQLLGWLLVFVGLVVTNELARRSKKGGIFFFMLVPAALTVYFAAIYIGAARGAEWALTNQTYTNMNSWFHYAKLYAATAGCIGFMMLKYKWGVGKTEWFKVFPFAIVALNILIAVASDFESGIKGAQAMKEFGDRWWLSSENVWLYGGWWNWLNGIAGIVNILCMTGWWGIYSSKKQEDMLWPDMIWLYADGVMNPAVRPTAVDPTMQGVIAIIALAVNVLVLTVIIKRAIAQKKNPYKNEIFTDTKDFQEAMARA